MPLNLSKFMKRYFGPRLTIMVVLMVVSFSGLGCAGRASESVSSADFAGEAAPAPAAAPAPEFESVNDNLAVDEALTEAVVQSQQQARVIIYTGDISLVVKDTQEAVTAIGALTAEVGGYVSASNLYETNQVPRGSVTLRVPAERYEETLAGLRALAERVESERSNSQDVTEEFTDLQARKSNLEVAETALQKLLEERERVGSTEDILQVYRELTDIRGQIEQIEGRLRYLSNQAGLSTITVELTPDALYQPVQVAGWQPTGVAKEALQALIFALQGVGNLLIWAVVFILPLLLVFLIPLLLFGLVVRWGWRRYQARRKQAPPAQE